MREERSAAREEWWQPEEWRRREERRDEEPTEEQEQLLAGKVASRFATASLQQLLDSLSADELSQLQGQLGSASLDDEADASSELLTDEMPVERIRSASSLLVLPT